MATATTRRSSEDVQEVCSVDSSLFGEAGVQPVGLHGHGLRVLSQQLLQLLDTHQARRRPQQQPLSQKRNETNNNWVPVAETRLVTTPTTAWTACSASATICVTSEPMVASSSPSYVLQLRIWSASTINATEFHSDSSLNWPTSASQRSHFDE